MKDYSKSLEVYINECPIGIARQDNNGRFEFSYYDNYDSTPLSLSMPVSNETYKNKVVFPYLMGLLPDNLSQRQALAARHDVSANNPIALLNFIGLDCPGAVRFVSSAKTEMAQHPSISYVALSADEIEEELIRIKEDEQASWQLPKEHWSLGGTQSKIALACFDGHWYRCEGDAATTHIIKPGIERLRHEALNECICQNVAIACGLPAAKASFALFGDTPALISERFDRRIEGVKQVARIHQEDFCQALSVDPENKYANEGGPNTASILSLLDKCSNSLENKIAFTLQLFFHYLIGSPDAHGKNYGILLDGQEVKIAPLYDCASALAYDGDDIDYKTAMSIGGERRFFHLKRHNVLRYAEQAQLSDELCLELIKGLAENILNETDGVFAKFNTFEGANDLAVRMKPKIALNCKNLIRELS
ncbi:HipA domain-containing protein [Eggerthellaceae bacterium 3-80]|nr:type II toxin-antitoxin system HipA family toxin [bacterium D16-34]